MELMPDEIRKALPDLYVTEQKKPEEIPVIVKYFNPSGAGTWYITEGREDTLFGLCVIHEPELGYVSLEELRNFKSKGIPGLGIERDLYWQGTLADAMRLHNYPIRR